jgi:hypothetical protein
LNKPQSRTSEEKGAEREDNNSRLLHALPVARLASKHIVSYQRCFLEAQAPICASLVSFEGFCAFLEKRDYKRAQRVVAELVRAGGQL